MRRKLFLFVSALIILSITLVGCNNSSGGQSVEEKSNSPQANNNAQGEIDFPNGDITFMIPNGPGGANDLSVRGLITGMEKELGVTVIPENKPASNGVVAAVELANSKPDGQTLYFNSQSVILLALQGGNIDLSKFQPVAQIVEDTSAITVHADAPYNSLQELVDYALENPGKLKIATNGKNALWDFSAQTFADAAGLELQYIAYTSGGSEMAAALASGEVDISANSPSEVRSLVEAGKLKVLAVQSEERHSLFPDVPTAQEQGFDAKFPVWRTVFTAKGTDEAILQKLEDSIKASWESDEFIDFLDNNGMPGKFRGYKESSEFFEEQIAMYEAMLN